jgi:hypothetical protein
MLAGADADTSKRTDPDRKEIRSATPPPLTILRCEQHGTPLPHLGMKRLDLIDLPTRSNLQIHHYCHRETFESQQDSPSRPQSYFGFHLTSAPKVR